MPIVLVEAPWDITDAPVAPRAWLLLCLGGLQARKQEDWDRGRVQLQVRFQKGQEDMQLPSPLGRYAWDVLLFDFGNGGCLRGHIALPHPWTSDHDEEERIQVHFKKEKSESIWG